MKSATRARLNPINNIPWGGRPKILSNKKCPYTHALRGDGSLARPPNLWLLIGRFAIFGATNICLLRAVGAST